MSCRCNVCDDSNGRRKVFEYAVKIVIGEISEGAGEKPLPVGAYFTKVNIHNFSRCDCVTFRWKVAIGHPHLRVGPTSELEDASLCPDEALEIDTSDIVRRIKGLAPPQGKKLRHTEGWVIIESPVELDVVAVYGTAADGQRPVTSFHTERVHPRCLPVCEDFGLDISTGVSAWEYKGPGDAAFAPATLSQPRPGWGAALPGSLWIVPGANQKPGKHQFRLRFKLCFGFRNPQLDLQLRADNFANVFLNGSQIPPPATSGNMYASVTTFAASAPFKAGDNELIVEVTNTTTENNWVGLDVAGSIFVEEGLCEGAPMPLLPCPQVCYMLHDRELWWNPFLGGFVDRDHQYWNACEGGRAGTMDGHRRAEQLHVSLTGAITPGTYLEYEVYTRSISGTSGWTGWTTSGVAGNSGPDQGITAIRVRLVNAPVNCRVRYRVCTRRRLSHYDFNPGPAWSAYSYDGLTAGTDTPQGWPPRYPPITAVEIEVL